MKLLFVNLSALKFNVATPDAEPLGGSESCICYLARQLAKNRHDVMVLARGNDAPNTVMDVRHGHPSLLQDGTFLGAEKFDVIIACNAPMLAPFLKIASPHSKIVLWDHVPPEQPSMQELKNPDVPKTLDHIVYVSTWQQQETEKRFDYSKPASVIGNGLTPSFENMFTSKQDLLVAKQNRAAYTTIPYRGLPLLLKAMEGLKHDMILDVFSSMRVYQMNDDEHAQLFRTMEQNPRVSSHGSVSQTELARHLKADAYLAYPCIVAETFCIAALEAMAAGMKVISTSLGALPTTTMGYADLVPAEPGNADKLIADFTQAMDRNIAAFQSHPSNWAEHMFEQVQVVNRSCTWAVRAQQWEKLLSAIH